jgi:hypothetical protein
MITPLTLLASLPCRVLPVAAAMIFFSVTSYSQVPIFNNNITAAATVYIDFDGQVVKGSAWNWDGPINAEHCGLQTADMIEIINRVAEDFHIFNLNVTTDEAVYLKAPIGKRIRLIVTPTHEWYGHAGGVAFVNSFTWGDDTPAWVFTVLLDNNAKYIAEAVSHEVGHTLGLQHQSTYNRDCDLVSEYAEGKGDGETGWAPIMGVSYYRNYTTWTYGTSIEGCKVFQNDIGIISQGDNNVGLRNDDFGNTRTTASRLPVVESAFSTGGIINDAADKDFFKIQLARRSRLFVSANPVASGDNSSGSNIDVLLTLSRLNGEPIISANPKLSLSASLDTVLNAGTYYLSADGINNQNVSDYGSVGGYVLSGTVTPVPSSSPVVLLSGSIRQNMHLLKWDALDRASLVKTYLEQSFDGVRYLPITTVPLEANYFSQEPLVSGKVHYRLRMILADESVYFSDAVILSSNTLSVLNTFVRDQVQVNSPGDYQYQLYDELGRLYQQGRVVKGLNTLPVNVSRSGLVLLKLWSKHEQITFKLIKQ